MKLALLGIIAAQKPIVFVGKPVPTGKFSSDDEEYFAWGLKEPVEVRCSTDSLIPASEWGELLIRASDLESDEWMLVDENNPAAGVTIPGWRADFSKSQEAALFQSTTISQWSKNDRKARAATRTSDIQKKLESRLVKR